MMDQNDEDCEVENEVVEVDDEAQEVDNKVVEVDNDPEDAPGPLGEKDASSISFQEWYSGSKYECRECGKIFPRYMGLYGHLRFTHRLSIAEYRAKNNNLPLMTTSSEITCICGRIVRRNYESLRDHAKTTHNMSLIDLYKELRKRGGKEDQG